MSYKITISKELAEQINQFCIDCHFPISLFVKEQFLRSMLDYFDTDVFSPQHRQKMRALIKTELKNLVEPK